MDEKYFYFLMRMDCEIFKDFMSDMHNMIFFLTRQIFNALKFWNYKRPDIIRLTTMENCRLWEIFSSGERGLVYKELDLGLGRMIQLFLLSWTFTAWVILRN